MHFVLAFTSKMFCSSGPHRYRVAPGMASGVSVCVCVCVASISLGRTLAPCCDCVYSFVTLSAALPSAHNWHRRRTEWSEGKEETDRGQEQSRLISCSLSSPPSLVIGEMRTISSNQCCRTQIPDLTGSSTGSAGLHRPGSSYCSVREYHSHGALPARAVLRSAKINWTPPAAGFRVVVAVHPRGTPCRTLGCVYSRTGCSISHSVLAICCI